MGDAVDEDSETPAEGGQEVEQDCHPQAGNINHGDEVAGESSDAGHHVLQIVKGGPVFRLLEEPCAGSLKDFVRQPAKEDVHAHADDPEDEHVQGGLRIDEVEHAGNHLEGEDGNQQGKHFLAKAGPGNAQGNATAPADDGLEGNEPGRKQLVHVLCNNRLGHSREQVVEGIGHEKGPVSFTVRD